MKVTHLLYISGFQFSGTTLLSFLLNSHPAINTVGHITGWRYGKDEDFYCSCGKVLKECPFFNKIGRAFSEVGLPFSYRNFGTDFRLARSERLNRLLISSLPFIHNTLLEKIRDQFVSIFPNWRKTLARQVYANKVFVGAALDYSGASVFLDNSHDPNRARILNSCGKFLVTNIHLIRDPRGVALSCLTKNYGWDATETFRLWLRRQRDIIRISREIPRTVIVYYEDLCNDVDGTLARIYKEAELKPQKFKGDFKETEHHILGNVMRLKGGKIEPDTKWKNLLPIEAKQQIEALARDVIRSNKDSSLRSLLGFYFD